MCTFQNWKTTILDLLFCYVILCFSLLSVIEVDEVDGELTPTHRDHLARLDEKETYYKNTFLGYEFEL